MTYDRHFLQQNSVISGLIELLIYKNINKTIK